MDKPSSETYLTSLLDKTLRVTITDTRMFLGQFKCTDSDRNIILSYAYEYRLPPPPKPTPTPSSPSTSPIVQDMTSRFLGLIVVPGDYITRIEVEEFESQMQGGRGDARGGVFGKGEVVVVGEAVKGGEAFCAGGVCEED